MSVTFSLPREFCAVTHADYESALSHPCSRCGGHFRFAPVEHRADPNPYCKTCYGEGGSCSAMDAYFARQAQVDGEFNVANGNAVYIVQDLLNLPLSEVYGGSLDPTTVLLRLATVFDTSQGVKEPSTSHAVLLNEHGVSRGCDVVHMGRSQRQCDSYVTRLRALAELAVERGAPEIVWG